MSPFQHCKYTQEQIMIFEWPFSIKLLSRTCPPPVGYGLSGFYHRKSAESSGCRCKTNLPSPPKIPKKPEKRNKTVLQKS